MLSYTWMFEGNCRNQGNPDDWYTSPDNPEEHERHYRAKAICRGCPVRALCLDYAQQTREESGIWGGFDPEERYDMRRTALRVTMRRALSGC